MNIDEIYINEAIRIRKVYLDSLLKIVEKEEDIKKYFDELDKIKEQIEKAKDENIQLDEKKMATTMIQINKNIEKIKNYISPYYDSIKGLNEDQRILYNNIRDKYPNITNDEIQTQIVPHIIPIDKQFRKENEKTYQKIMERKK